ncbi:MULTISPECIES: AAA family ATPase [Pseudomonas]|uniref:Endonuclease GajA/Old nuclease/RecF-like AAA domain-containing protein n=1 Tax=Pseudomonas mosselii TaxID=78327 RepID=A0A5R8ZGY9_9PSED|nr:AAA family ATPase [Pseudomonas mosselii]TLP65030.1 hypothetical protein FEM01_02300 [Pseudomonas mosselii]
MNVPFSSEFECAVDELFNVNIQRRHRPQVNFYDGHSFQAIIGQNGSGKSSVIDAINVFEGDSDSLVLAVFYDDGECRYKICLNNIFSERVTVEKADLPFDFVENVAEFFKANRVDVVHINAIQEVKVDDGLPIKRSRGSYVRRLTVPEAMRSQNTRRDYFNRYLRYFRRYLGGEYRENIRYMFSLSSSSIGRFESALVRYRHAVDSKLIGQWLKDFKLRERSLDFPLHSDVERAVVGMNVPSIINSLAKRSSNADLEALHLLENYALLDYERPDTHPVDLIENALKNYLAARSDSGPEAKKGDASSRQHEPEHQEVIRANLSLTLAKLESFAMELYHANPDDTKLDLSGVIVEDYEVVEKLTEIASRLPGAVAGNIRWGWRGASTGELARAHVFSEFFNYLIGRAENTSSIVFMDEADLYLHPEWQRNFVSDLLALSRHADNDVSSSSLQVIVCTHSPIIVSDFLSSDIISLKVDEYAGLSVEKSAGFGSSIVDIYMDDMHLSSTFGEHAGTKLGGLIEAAKRHMLSEADRRLINEITSDTTRSFLLSYDKNQ